MSDERCDRDRVTGGKFRWWLAPKLNRLPGMCWANLVTWALGWTGLRESRDRVSCGIDLARNGHCYCGKLKSDV